MFETYNHNFTRDFIAFLVSGVPSVSLLALCVASIVADKWRRPRVPTTFPAQAAARHKSGALQKCATRRA
jgi:hypothetical protein